MPAWNGGRSRRAGWPGSGSRTGSASWLLTVVWPWPGKCLMRDATPADSSPVTAAATWAATLGASEPNEREPMTKLPGEPSTSASGAKSTLMPTAASSAPAASPRRLGEVGPGGRAERHRAGQLHHAGLDPGDPAVLLVGGDERSPSAGAAPTRRGRPQRVGEAAHLGRRRLGRRVLDVAHQDDAAEVVRVAWPTRCGRSRQADRRHQDLTDQVGDRTAWPPGRLARSRPGRCARAAASWRGAVTSAGPDGVQPATHAAARARAPPTRRRRRAGGRRAPDHNHILTPVRTPHASADLREPRRGRSLAGVAVRLELGVPGRAEQAVEGVGDGLAARAVVSTLRT